VAEHVMAVGGGKAADGAYVLAAGHVPLHAGLDRGLACVQQICEREKQRWGKRSTQRTEEREDVPKICAKNETAIK
jgi:hypothetical protein